MSLAPTKSKFKNFLEFDKPATKVPTNGFGPWTIGQRVQDKKGRKGVIKCYHSKREEVHIWYDDSANSSENVSIKDLMFIENNKFFFGSIDIPPNNSSFKPPKWAAVNNYIRFKWEITGDEYYAVVVAYDPYSRRSLIYNGFPDDHKWCWIYGSKYRPILKSDMAKISIKADHFNHESCDCCTIDSNVRFAKYSKFYSPFNPMDYRLTYDFFDSQSRMRYCMLDLNPASIANGCMGGNRKKKNANDKNRSRRNPLASFFNMDAECYAKYTKPQKSCAIGKKK